MDLGLVTILNSEYFRHHGGPCSVDPEYSASSAFIRNPQIIRMCEDMGKVCKYYSNWQHEVFTCSECGWTGNVSHEDLEAGDVAAIIECPKCYRSLGVLLYPNLEETKEAAANGNEEAIKGLPSFESRIERNWELLDRFEQEKLRSANQLPDLDGEALEFDWDFEKGEDGEFYQVIRTGDAEVWRELAFFNNVPRFEEIKGMLKAKYGTRFKSLTPIQASIEWLSGDNLGKALQISHV